VRTDIDRHMRQQGLAGLVVFAYDRACAPMYYVTGQKLHYAIWFRAADGREHLVHDPMERDQADASGIEHSSFAQHRLAQLQEEEGSPLRAFARIIATVLESMGIAGRVAFQGDMPPATAYVLLQRIVELAPGITIDTAATDVLTLARTTKDERELAIVRAASGAAVSAIERTLELLRSLRRDGTGLVDGQGEAVKLGRIRRLIQREFLEHGFAEDGESIVSQGRDAGVPHNRGNDDEVLRPGTPLLIDIFPGEAGGGWHTDMTRTYCVGPAPEPLKQLYGDVHAAFTRVMSELAVGEPCRRYQELTCDVFEQRGHATVRSKPGTEEGYVHGLGHGVGLAVHEAPRLGGPPSNTQKLEPGMVITIEPGLYYPSRNLGVRIEDLVVVRPDGTVENYTPAPYDLEIAPRG